MSRQQDDRILKPFLAQLPDCLASVHIRQTDVQNDEVGRLSMHHVERPPRRIRLDGQEFFVQGELLGQGRTQICVVVGDQDLGPGGDRGRDQDTLQHPAGELVHVLVLEHLPPRGIP